MRISLNRERQCNKTTPRKEDEEVVVVVEVEVEVMAAVEEEELEENVEPSKEVAADCFSACKRLHATTVGELCFRDRLLVRLR